jgi:hypothetical protein
MLWEMSAADDMSTAPIFLLDSHEDLTRLADKIETNLEGRNRIERGAGLILIQPTSFTSLYGSILQGLDEALTRAEARLIITVDSAVSVSDQDLRDYIVEVTDTPDHSAITTAHLTYRAGGELADQLLARDDVKREIAQQLATEPSCKLASELAEAIKAEADRAGSVAAFDVAGIQAWRSRRGAEDFDIWFADLGDTRSRSFAIALAVLNGLPYDAIAKAARALYKKFDAPAYMVMASSDDVPPEGQRPFLVPHREWLHKLHARASETEVRGTYGPSYAVAVQYTDRDYMSKVLDRAFSDYQAQDKLLAWLGDLAQDSSEKVRIFAATALGKLTARSFDYLSRNFLAAWARSDQEFQREAVAVALRSVIVTDPRLSGNVRLMVAGWYGNRDDPNEQATAARAHGVAYGRTDPVAAFEALNRLTVIDNVDVAIAIGDSIIDLLAGGTDDLIGFVLRCLAESVQDRKRSAAAQLAFLVLAAPLDKEVPAEGPDTRIVNWPLLLYLMAHLPEARVPITSIWRYVLNDGLLPNVAESVMTRWAGAAESEPEMCQAFLRMARAIAHGDERSGMVLSRYTAHWASSENLQPVPRVAAALQAILTAERGIR